MTQAKRILWAATVIFASAYGSVSGLGAASESNLNGRLISSDDLKPRPGLAKSFKELIAMLEYDNGETPLAYAADLNRDGTTDYLIRSSNRLCGTAGCPHILVDGKTKRTVGEFFGGVVILDRKINGYPVIQAVSKYDINASHLMTFVYDEGRYRQVGYALLESRGMDTWFKGLKK